MKKIIFGPLVNLEPVIIIDDIIMSCIAFNLVCLYLTLSDPKRSNYVKTAVTLVSDFQNQEFSHLK